METSLRQAKAKKVTVYHEADWELAAAAFCILAGSLGLLLVNNSKLWNQVMQPDSSVSRVGALSRETGAVRQRSARGFFWSDVVSSDQEVGDGDVVFTGTDGQARLSLDSGTTAQISANSLIKIQT